MAKKRFIISFTNQNFYNCNTTYVFINHLGGNIKMIISNTNLNVCINKIKMMRPGNNPQSCDLNLNVDWSIEYTKTDEGNMEYLCTLDATGKMPIQFAIQGFLECETQIEDLEKRSDELSPLILDKCMNTMINIVNITKNSIITIKTVPEVYLNCVSSEFTN